MKSSLLFSILRWITVLPLSIVGGMLGAWVFTIIGSVPLSRIAGRQSGWQGSIIDSIAEIWAPNLVNGVLIIVLAFLIVPAYKRVVAISIGSVHLIFLTVMFLILPDVQSRLYFEFLAVVLGTLGAALYIFSLKSGNLLPVTHD